MKLKLLVPLLVAIGIGLGLAYAWLVSPVKFTDASPAQVITDYQHTWLIMSAEAYAQDGNWARTQERVASLLDPNVQQTIAQLFDQYNAQGPNPIARALAILADRYDVHEAPMLVYLSTPIVASPTPSPTAQPQLTSTPTPALTPTQTPIPATTLPVATQIPAYRVINSTSICRPESIRPQIQVTIQDANGLGVPGKEVWIIWDAGADRFVTGLKPEIDPGYGDFDMSIDQTYSVAIDKPTAIVITGLHADECAQGRLTWQLTVGPSAP